MYRITCNSCKESHTYVLSEEGSRWQENHKTENKGHSSFLVIAAENDDRERDNLVRTVRALLADGRILHIETQTDLITSSKISAVREALQELDNLR